MKKPDYPLNEAARLNTLRSLQVLDTEAEERFDRLTRMAKRLFNVPIALVSLVDESRQWFKSRQGLDANETSRDISFCGHAILEDDIFIIPNAMEDERFFDNPLVTDAPNIRFYAGCPLKAANGCKLGTLCIIDQEPRHFDIDDFDALADLATMVEQELSAIQMATIDELTQISNRRGFSILAQHYLNLYIRENISACLIYIDLDEFKPINDNFGHAEGDRALTVFAEQLSTAFRQSDIVARMGGDEFAVLLTNYKPEDANTLITRLRRNLSKINKAADRGYDIEFSYGVIEFSPSKHATIEQLLADTDKEMYAAKQMKDKI